MESHIGFKVPKTTPKLAISHIFEFQLYFSGFLQVYVRVLLLKKYLTSKTEKNVRHAFLFFFSIYEPPDLGKNIFTTWNLLQSEIYITCIDFWKFHDDLKAYLEVIRLPSWSENVKFSVKVQFVMFLTS